MWAAARCSADAIVLLAELGWDVNALARTDVPMEQAWETALHEAAARGDVQLARLLLDLGADPDIKDTRFDSTPLGWARHFGQQATIELLQPPDQLAGRRLSGRRDAPGAGDGQLGLAPPARLRPRRGRPGQ